ncbi:pyridoxal phosphate-dependent transferase [Chytriomyces sp. MP71]|nr:pyridoxal phosphate-dependent transferase [Chytriomyces sp. MP71]
MATRRTTTTTTVTHIAADGSQTVTTTVEEATMPELEAVNTHQANNMSADEFRKRGHETVERIAKYYEDLARSGTDPSANAMKALSTVQPGYLKPLLPDHAPENGESWDTIQRDIEDKIFPGITHWQHPNFYAFFPSNSSFPGILGEMYSAMFNVIGFNWQTSPACTELETIVLDWMVKAMGLDEGFLSTGEGGGVIQGSASEAICVAIIAARQRMLDSKRAEGMSEEDVITLGSKLIAYGSTQTHSATKKGAMIANVRFRALDVDTVDFSLSGETVAQAIQEDLARGLIPFYITATIGTTSSGALDDLPGIVRAAAPHGVWVNIDAAWAGAATVCPEFRETLAGTESADSYSFNMHKWLLTNFDCSPLWVRQRRFLTNALSVTPVYLRNAASESGFVRDYRDWQLPLGRRFRALKIWFVLRTYGLEGLRAHIRKHVAQCVRVTEYLRSRPDLYRIVTGPNWSLVTFAIVPPVGSSISANDLTNAVYDRINADGDIFLTHTVLNDIDVIRFVTGARLTEDAHVEFAIKAIERVTSVAIAELA